LGVVLGPDEDPLATTKTSLEHKLTGASRLHAVSDEAAAWGIRPGFSIAQAKSKFGDVNVRVLPRSVVTHSFERMADAALAFGTCVSFEASISPSSSERRSRAAHLGAQALLPTLWLDVTGCAHLHGEGVLGEEQLAQKFVSVLRALGHHAIYAVADGPQIAAAFATALAQNPRGLGRGAPGVVIASAERTTLLGALPLASFPFPAEDLRALERLGVHDVEDLRKVATAGLTMRLSVPGKALLPLIHGRDDTPLVPYRPPEVLVESAPLDHPIEHQEALLFVGKMLADRLAARLLGRGLGVTELALRLDIDVRALGIEATCEPTQTKVMHLPSGLQRASEIFAVLRTTIERQLPAEGAAQNMAPVRGVHLCAMRTHEHGGRAMSLLETAPKAEGKLDVLAAELSSLLGEGSVGFLQELDAWRPTARSRLRPFHAASRRANTKTLGTRIEPTLLLREPLAVSLRDTTMLGRAYRLDAPDWWAEPSREPCVEEYWVALIGERLGFLRITKAGMAKGSDKSRTPRIVPAPQAHVVGWLD
jgi:protein ImuB